jgi:hypothetical protein
MNYTRVRTDQPSVRDIHLCLTFKLKMQQVLTYLSKTNPDSGFIERMGR